MSRPRSPTQGASKPPFLKMSYIGVFRASPLERIAMIKHGVPAPEAKRIMAELAIKQGTVLKALNFSTATINKKAKQEHTLSQAESERVIGIAKLIGQLEVMIQESGDPEGFDAMAWISRWLQEPLPSLGGAQPIDLMDTMEGQALVANMLSQVQSGAYA